MAIRYWVTFTIAALCLMLVPSTGYALRAPAAALAASLTDDEREALGTLALADERMRDAILEASLHPRAIERIASISRESSERFRERLNDIPRAKQKEIWELTRYPELIDALVLGGRPARGAIADIVAPYPEAIRDIATRMVRNEFNLLNDVAHMRSDAERETAKLVASLPIGAQANFEALIERPELMTALADHPAVLERLGSYYRDDPLETREAFDRYHEEEALRNDRAIAEWRDAIEDDPAARAELIESAEAFAEAEGYESPREVERVSARTEVHHYYHPYPYWFGTPYWYSTYNWYPYRAHWGFAFDTAGAFFVYGLPSAYYSAWHYRDPVRRHHYRRLDHHFSRHASHFPSHRHKHASARHAPHQGSRIRAHASSHKRSNHSLDLRSRDRRDGQRHQGDHRAIRRDDHRRDSASQRGGEAGGRGSRSRIGTRDGTRDGEQKVQSRKNKSKFREATERARSRDERGSSIKSRSKGDRREVRRGDSRSATKRNSKSATAEKHDGQRPPKAKIRSHSGKQRSADSGAAKKQGSSEVRKKKSKRSNGGRNFARR